jgi:hypothetical protein
LEDPPLLGVPNSKEVIGDLICGSSLAPVRDVACLAMVGVDEENALLSVDEGLSWEDSLDRRPWAIQGKCDWAERCSECERILSSEAAVERKSGSAGVDDV